MGRELEIEIVIRDSGYVINRVGDSKIRFVIMMNGIIVWGLEFRFAFVTTKLSGIFGEQGSSRSRGTIGIGIRIRF